MSKTVWFITYKLKEGAYESEYLLASKKVNDEILSQQKGFVSWEVLRDGDTWVDLVVWETPEDSKNAQTAGQGNPSAKEYYSLMDFKSLTNQIYSVEKSY